MAEKVKLKARKFRALLERLPGSLNWTIARLPFDSSRFWGVRGTVRVKGEINRVPLRTSLFPQRDGRHFIVINKNLQKAAGVKLGMQAQFVLQQDDEERRVETPPELARVFRQSRRLQKFYESFSLSLRSYIVSSINGSKQPETRKRRAEQAAEQLMEIMEAEQELPPLIRQAFQRNPTAAMGWEIMPPAHRRMHLFGIFNCRSLDARLRRLERAMEDMAEYAEKKRERGAVR
jgi:uncharacterized protein YdeI (YjbR/CyaY-like superfamily)